MKVSDSNELRALVGRLVVSSNYASLFNGADVEVSDYDDDAEFIRIIVHFNNLEELSDDDVDAITSSIEGAVSQKDDRFPSIRFSEP